MNIITVRHTSVAVPNKICYGQTDVALSQSFDEEKKTIREKLKHFHFQSVYSSPLTRCSRLAKYLSNGLPIIYDSRLIELDFGKWEGQHWDCISHTGKAKLWFDNWLDIPCPGGESYKQLICRVNDFVQHIKSFNNDVLIISHGGVIRALASLINNIEPQVAFSFKVNYGEIMKFSTNA